MIETAAAIDQLVSDGYCVLPCAVSLKAIESALEAARRDAPDVPIDPSGGLPWAYDVWPEDYWVLAGNARRIMVELGAMHSSVNRVTLIKKAAGEPRRYWHNDWDVTRKPNGAPPREVLALYYLTPTRNGEGSLLVRPKFVEGPAHEEHDNAARPDEMAVPVSLGDVVLMDPRLQHASLQNETSDDRLLIRVWTVNLWK